MVAGTRYKLVADLASCMKKGGAGFYARQGWACGGHVEVGFGSGAQGCMAPAVVAGVKLDNGLVLSAVSVTF